MILRGLALLFLLTIANSASPLRAETTERILEELRSLKITSTRYNLLLAHYFDEAEASGDIEEKINLSATPLPGAINIVVVESPRGGTNDMVVHTLGVPVRELARNVVAVNNNLIIVGEDALVQVYLSAYNNVLAVSQSGGMLGSVVFGDPYQYVQSMASYLDLSNTAAMLSNNDVEYNDAAAPWTQHPVAVTREFAKSDKRMNDFFYLALSFVFQHEISHLHANSPGGFRNFEELIRGFYNWRRKGEEEAADEEGMRKLAVAFERYKGSNAMFAVTGLSLNFRDQLLNRYFDGLGGVAAKDRFVSFMHNGCNTQSVEANGLRRDNINLVMAGYMSPLPILSEMEFSNVRDKINWDETRSTHPHSLVRAIRLTQAVSNFFLNDDPINPLIISTLNPYLEMLKSIADGHPYIDQNYFGNGTRVPAADFWKFVDAHFVTEKSASCESPLICFVGASKNGARLEFGERSGFVAYATLYLPVVDRVGEDAQASVMPEAEEALHEMLGVPDVIVDRNFEFAMPQNAVDVATYELSNCGFHWSLYFFLEGYFEISTWKGGEALQVRMLPAGYDVFGGP